MVMLRLRPLSFGAALASLRMRIDRVENLIYKGFPSL